jgi:aryl-alcohol dehydrogenase-like predicted oxidoreductase
MQKGKLGDNLEVSALGLGCTGLSFGLGCAKDRSEAVKTTFTKAAARPRASINEGE